MYMLSCIVAKVICFVSSVYEVHLEIMNARLYNFAADNNEIDEVQTYMSRYTERFFVNV
jgi:hypothetical protein